MEKPTILCVDDLPENLKVRTMLLEKFGCNTVTAFDRKSVFQALGEHTVNLVLIDYHLGEENGEDIAREVRKTKPGLPLVMLTGDPKLPDSASESVDAVLVKGASGPRDLFALIQKLLPQ